MSKVKLSQLLRMLEKAQAQEAGPMYLPGDCKAWDEAAILQDDGKVYFFWNDETGNTRAIVEPLEE